MRFRRTNGSTTYSYVYNGSSLSQMTVGGNTLYFAYDASGAPMAVTYNNTTYYYVTNLQGDVTAILNTSGTAVVQYTYDAWGNILSTTGDLATTLGTHNPLRYRGYVYDSETGLCYCQSRYYSPKMGRFIGADSVISGVGDVQGYNLFAYCFNNPVSMSDPSGNWPQWLTNAVNWVIDKLGISTSAGSTKKTGSSATAKGPSISRNTSLGVYSSTASASLGYATGSVRGQLTQKVDSNTDKITSGLFGKSSILNLNTQTRIGTQDAGISKKDVLDVGAVTAQAGIQYKDGLGVALGVKASVVTARGTYCMDVLGWQVEFGMNADFLTCGYEVAYGALPDGGWGVNNKGLPGLFSIGYLIRITPP